ncbi:flagellar basal body-associated protein FliL [Paraburkholderia sp. CNPSo 3157]|uniref:Flagellar protein FliL n=1 Tax=Paraburkholderia franconis TaxID=2654983 RepID=A0A7X1TGS0_9BURK|nr:flagellar basal body-associated protein FliL [Paraburkholderia franconis]MPW18566.1 flagellar basal body-associated protein FliL [Paraburkholderia franconis]
MASTTANQPANAKPSSPGLVNRIVVILLIALVAAGAAGAATWFFMSKRAPSAAMAAGPVIAAAPIFFPLESMTVNLQSDDGQLHYLRIGLTLKLADQRVQEHLTEHMPEIRSRVLLALSARRPDELATLDGKKALAKELETLVEQPTEPNGLQVRVEDVLFTEFVVQ